MRASLSCSLSSLGGGGGAGRGSPLSTALSTKHATSPSAIVPLSAAILLARLEGCNPDASAVVVAHRFHTANSSTSTAMRAPTTTVTTISPTTAQHTCIDICREVIGRPATEPTDMLAAKIGLPTTISLVC